MHAASSEDARWSRGLGRNGRVYAFLRFVLRGYIRRRFDFTTERYEPREEPFLLVLNHNSDWDPFFACMTIHRYMRFVASDHLFRKGIVSALIRFLANPIPKRKGADSHEVIDVIERNLRLGVNVALFAEGNKSFNGLTGFISPRTGEMVKESGGALITYRVEGGYLQSPRWAKYIRKGRIYGHVVGEYSRAELDKLSADEINAIIRRDLRVNAFEKQREQPQKYVGKNLAESLENVLYVCPKCRGVATMTGRGDDFYCTCGYTVKYNEYGFFEGDGVVFDNVCDWDVWQRGEFEKICRAAKPDDVITRDEGQQIFKVEGSNKIPIAESGTITLLGDRIELAVDSGVIRLPLTSVNGIGIIRHNLTVISAAPDYYEVRCKVARSGLKYFAGFRFLTGREYL